MTDGSVFGRHGKLVGGRHRTCGADFMMKFPAGTYALEMTGQQAIAEKVAIGAFGCTWQGMVKLRELTGARIVELLGGGVAVSAPEGRVVCSVMGKEVKTDEVVVRKDVWVSLAVRLAPDAVCTIFVDGAPVRATGFDRQTGKPFPATQPVMRPQVGNVDVWLGQGVRGAFAEQRVWSRALTDAEIRDTTGRRIHPWAPGLAMYARLGDEFPMNSTADACTGAIRRIMTWGSSSEQTGSLQLRRAPDVNPPRVAALTNNVQLQVGTVGMTTAGCTLQVWVHLDELAAGFPLYLSHPGFFIGLRCDPQGGLSVEHRGGGFSVPGVLKAMRWTHLTVTLDGQGLICVYRDGALVARGVGLVMTVAPNAAVYVGCSRGCAFSEARVYGRALSANDVAANWKFRTADAPGLVCRNPLQGPGDVQGRGGAAEVLWREAPSLVLPDLPPPRATVTSNSTLLADQTGSNQVPLLALDLTALDGAGKPLAGAALRLICPREVHVRRGHPSGPLLRVGADTPPVIAGPDGKVRLLLAVDRLLAPVFQVRHAGMGAGEWVLISPDTVIHQALASLTAQELRSGRRGTASTRAGTTGLVDNDADKLAALLHGMLGAAARFSFEAQSTAALAFGDDEPPPTAEPLEPLPAVGGDTFVLPDDCVLVRRVGDAHAQAVVGDQDSVMPQAFYDWDDFTNDVGDGLDAVGDGVKKGFDTVGDGVKKGLDTVGDGAKKGFDAAAAGVTVVVNYAQEGAAAVAETVVKAAKVAVESVTVMVDTVINGCKVAYKAVLRTVEEIAEATVTVFQAIGRTVTQVLQFLAGIYDWDDYVETGEFMLGQLRGAIQAGKAGAAGAFAVARRALRGAEAQLAAVHGRTAPAGAQARHAAQWSGAELTGPLDYLLGLLGDGLGGAMNGLRPVLEPMRGALLAMGPRFAALGDGVASQWSASGLGASLADPRKLLDGDPARLIELGKVVARVGIELGKAAVDLAADTTAAMLDALLKLLDVRIDIPLLTSFVETLVLGGRSLTVGRLLCLIAAIPATLIYKLVTGSSDGPFSSRGAHNFADDQADLALRFVDAFILAIGGAIDTAGAVSKGVDDNRGVKFTRWIVDGIRGVVIGNPHMTKKILQEDDKLDVVVAFDYLSWTAASASWACTGYALVKGDERADKAGTVLGALGVGFSAISGAIALADEIDEMTEGARSVAILDLTRTIAELGAGLTGLIPDPTARVIASASCYATALGCSCGALGVLMAAD